MQPMAMNRPMAKFTARRLPGSDSFCMRRGTYARLVNVVFSPGQAGASMLPGFFLPADRMGQETCMQNGLYVAVSAEIALERRLETIADNISNMNTVGYRATGVSFEAEMAKAGD